MGQYSIVVEESHSVFTELVQNAREGDRASFDQIIRLIEKNVLKTAFCLTGNLEDAEDIAQEVFVKIFQRIQTLTDESKLRGWALRITVNTSRDHLRKRKLFVSLQKLILWKKPSDPTGKSEFHSRLANALALLSTNERAVFVLKEIHETKTEEVARILGCKDGTVRTHLFTARKKLRIQLGDYREES